MEGKGRVVQGKVCAFYYKLYTVCRVFWHVQDYLLKFVWIAFFFKNFPSIWLTRVTLTIDLLSCFLEETQVFVLFCFFNFVS